MNEKIDRYNLLIDSLEFSSLSKIHVDSDLVKEAQYLAKEIGVTYPKHTEGYINRYRIDEGIRLLGTYNGIPVYKGTELANEVMQGLLGD